MGHRAWRESMDSNVTSAGPFNGNVRALPTRAIARGAAPLSTHMIPATTLPASLSVREARDRYLAENGFSIIGYTAPTFTVDLFGHTFTFPNGPARRRAIPLHDLQHVVTGYGTDLVGEAEQSAWELMGGVNSLFLWVFKLSAILLGLFLAPRRVIRSMRLARARGCRTLYGDPVDYESLLAMSLGELRARLSVPLGGQAEHEAARHRRAPGVRRALGAPTKE